MCNYRILIQYSLKDGTQFYGYTEGAGHVFYMYTEHECADTRFRIMRIMRAHTFLLTFILLFVVADRGTRIGRRFIVPVIGHQSQQPAIKYQVY